MNVMENSQNDSTVNKDNLPYSHCLNCGTELDGIYCHKCGQKATNATPKVKDFVLEYAGHAFIWDNKFFSTVWRLLSKPGLLTQEFCQGKFVSYMHPLKLNMFLLLVFVTMFLMFSDTDKIKNLNEREDFLSGISVASLAEDSVYMKKIEQSSMDTIKIYAPVNLTEDYSEIISLVEMIKRAPENSDDELDIWMACVPAVLLEDGVLEMADDGLYHFSANSELIQQQEDIQYVVIIWKKLMESISKYFPILLLLTAPILACAVRFVNRKKRYKFFQYFIFALHYTAVVELLVLLIYLLYIFFKPSQSLLQYIIIICPFIYMIFALRRVYEVKSWFKVVLKSIIINFTYLLICSVLVFIALLVLVISVASTFAV